MYSIHDNGMYSYLSSACENFYKSERRTARVKIWEIWKYASSLLTESVLARDALQRLRYILQRNEQREFLCNFNLNFFWETLHGSSCSLQIVIMFHSKISFLLKISLKYFCLGAVHKFLLLYSICVGFSVVICICELYMSWVKSSSWVLKSELQRIHSPRFEAQVESGFKRGRFHPPKWMIFFGIFNKSVDFYCWFSQKIIRQKRPI